MRLKSCSKKLFTGTESLEELVSALVQRLGLEDGKEKMQLLVGLRCYGNMLRSSILFHVIKKFLPFVLQYMDDEGDRVLLSTDSDLVGAVNHAKLAGWKVFFLLISFING